jgi:hypothetical protein
MSESLMGQMPPRAEVKSPEPEMSHQQIAIRWATDVLEAYRGLPKNNHRERQRAKDFVEVAAIQLLTNPENIDTAVSLWKSRESSQEHSGKKEDSFYKTIKEVGAQLMKKDWKIKTHEELAGLVRVYANSILGSDFAQELLTNYFNGPDSIVQRVDARYKFAFAALDLVDDQKAFKQAARIGFFATPIIPRMSSSYFLDRESLKTLAYNVDDATLQKFLAAETVFKSCAIAASEDIDKLYAQNRFFAGTDRKYQNNLIKEEEKARKKLGEEGYKQRTEKLKTFYSMRVLGPKGSFRLIEESWPGNLAFNKNEPLLQKERRLLGSKADFYAVQQQMLALAEAKKIETMSSFSIQLPDGFVVNIFIPEALMNKKNDILREALALGSQPKVKEHISDTDNSFVSNYWLNSIPVNDTSVFFAVRRSSLIEENQHPIQVLGEIGFPFLRPKDAESLESLNEKLADEIKKNQIRYLNRRGVRIPLNNSLLKGFGYSHLNFYKDANDAEKILVEIFVKDVTNPYSVKLDKYLNFDFGSKKFDSPALSDNLKFILLSYLNIILCEERIGKEGELLGEEGREVVSRMGHLRWAPEKFRNKHYYSARAEKNYLEIEGKDLCTRNLERMEQFKGTEREGLESTYEKPVKEKEENLPPLTLNLPDPLKV